MEKYDLCVIGGGPSGYAAAMRAIDFGKKVCLIEEAKVGGAGIYNGALSSKTIWEVSQKVKAINDTTDDTSTPFSMPWEQVKQTVSEAEFDRKFQYQVHIKLLQEEAENIDFSYLRGHGKLLSDHEVEITRWKKGELKNMGTIWAENIILSTGSTPRKLPNIPVDEEVILTSDGIHGVSDYPKSLVIVGAGVIGCEYATMFSNFGKTKVYLIDRADRILPFEDEDIAELITRQMEEKGVTVHRTATLERMEKVNDHVEYELSYKDGRESEVIKVEKALLAVGRVPNVNNLGLDNAGVSMSKRGVHIGDNDTQTNVPNIYAVGDVSGHIALVNMGELEARHAVEKIYENKQSRMSYDNVCTIMFLDPEVASVGMNEKQCREQNIPYKAVKIDYSCIARAIAMRKTDGFFKILVTNDDEMKILGMRAIGEHASSAIQAVALLIKQDLGVEALADMIYPHPSIIEGIQECVRMLLNKSIFKSAVFKDKLACYSYVEGVRTELQRL